MVRLEELEDGVLEVSSSGMNWLSTSTYHGCPISVTALCTCPRLIVGTYYRAGLADHDKLPRFILVQDEHGRSSDGRFVSVDRVSNDVVRCSSVEQQRVRGIRKDEVNPLDSIAVLEDQVGSSWFPVDRRHPALQSVFLRKSIGNQSARSDAVSRWSL